MSDNESEDSAPPAPNGDSVPAAVHAANDPLQHPVWRAAAGRGQAPKAPAAAPAGSHPGRFAPISMLALEIRQRGELDGASSVGSESERSMQAPFKRGRGGKARKPEGGDDDDGMTTTTTTRRMRTRRMSTAREGSLLAQHSAASVAVPAARRRRSSSSSRARRSDPPPPPTTVGCRSFRTRTTTPRSRPRPSARRISAPSPSRASRVSAARCPPRLLPSTTL